jgi:two-component system sensor histidine kinase PilS (NtrC family)
MDAAAWRVREESRPDSFWVSLSYFNIYRLLVAGMFLLAVLVYDDTLSFGTYSLTRFTYASIGYLVLAAVFQVLLRRYRAYFDLQLSLHVITDIVATVLLMNASSGMRSGLGVMLLISLAAAALVSQRKLMLFYAALASIAVLLEQGFWVLVYDQTTAGFVQPGLLSIGYFATALITNQLARRVITNERVARQRGADLANQLRINQLVIQDVQDGVLVVDSNGLVRQFNPQVAVLLGGGAVELAQVEDYSRELAEHLGHWRRGGASHITLRPQGSGKVVRARFVEAGIEGGSFTLIFLDDMSRMQEQAQQLKLAALGRLTANIAHEIRNPLSAITHASDLLQEEHRAEGRGRLTSIIHDNAHRLDRMVSDVLELSRRDRVQTETLRLRQFLESFIEDFAIREDVPRESLVLEAEDELEVEMDRVHLHQVVWNLLRNATRHSRKLPGSVRLQVLRQSNRVELIVVDDGPGLARELQSQLVEPFFTTYSGGTGLGLYIARELCAANGATLDYIDRGAGAHFRIQWQSHRQ